MRRCFPEGRQFALELFKNGIFLNPMGTKLYLSLAHTEEDLQEMLEISRDVLKRSGREQKTEAH